MQNNSIIKAVLLFVSYLLLATNLLGCAQLRQITRPITKAADTVSAVLLPSHSGLKAKIAVADFENKTAKTGDEVCADLRKSLINALNNTNRFSLSEPNAKASDLFVAVSVAEFEPRVSGGKAGVGGGGGAGSVALGGLLGASFSKAHMALDIRVMQVATQELVSLNRVQGQASDITRSIAVSSRGTGELNGVLSVYSNTPMEKAIRICIAEAVHYISGAIPQKYYKYRGNHGKTKT